MDVGGSPDPDGWPPEGEEGGGDVSFEDREARLKQLVTRWLRRRLFAAFNTWQGLGFVHLSVFLFF